MASNNIEETIEIRTVGEMIDYLKKFPSDRLLLKSEASEIGYKLFEATRIEYYIVRPNPDPTHPCPFVDASRNTTYTHGETECALVL